MFNSLRKNSVNFFVKILLVMIIGSFVLWGIGDVFRNMQGDKIVTVGKISITFPEFQERYAQFVRMNNIPAEQSPKYVYRVLEHLVQSKVLFQEAETIGITIGHDILAHYISNIKAFHNEKDLFDKEIFNSYLRNNHISEQDFTQMVKEEVAVNILMDSMFESNFLVPGLAVQVALNKKSIQDVVIVEIDGKLSPSEQEVNQKDIEEYYNQNKLRYMTPKLFDISILLLSPQKITDQTIMESIEDALAEGGQIKDIAKNFNLESIELKNVTESSLQNNPKQIDLKSWQTMTTVINNLEEGTESELITINDGKDNAIIKLNKLSEPLIQPLDQVSNKIKQDILQAKKDKQSLSELKKFKRTMSEKGMDFILNSKDYKMIEYKQTLDSKAPQNVEVTLWNNLWNTQQGILLNPVKVKEGVWQTAFVKAKYPYKGAIDPEVIRNTTIELINKENNIAIFTYGQYLLNKYKVKWHIQPEQLLNMYQNTGNDNN